MTEPENKLALRRRTTFSDKIMYPCKNETMGLTPFEKNKILTMYSVAKKILEGERVNPLMAVVYPSYVCNHNCQGCSYQEVNRKEKAFLDPKNFVILLNSLQKLEVKSIEFSGGGEPTLHPKFYELAKQTVDEGFELGLLTNGSLLTDRIADLVVDHFSYIRVNIDASDMQAYNQIHRPPETYAFQTILKNLEGVISKKNQTNSKLTIGARVLICQTNMNFIEDIINLVKDLGCDYVQFKLRRNAKDSLLPEQVESVHDFIKTLQKKYHPFLVCGGVKGWRTHRECWLPPIHIVVAPLGEVYPCCHYQYRRESTLIGNLFEQSIEEIWFGQRQKEVINHLRAKECNLYDCRWHYYNEIMWQMVKENKSI